MRSKYYTPFKKTPLKWIPLSKSGASKSRPLWAAHTRIGNVWEYPPGPQVISPEVMPPKTTVTSRQDKMIKLSSSVLHDINVKFT